MVRFVFYELEITGSRTDPIQFHVSTLKDQNHAVVKRRVECTKYIRTHSIVLTFAETFSVLNLQMTAHQKPPRNNLHRQRHAAT